MSIALIAALAAASFTATDTATIGREDWGKVVAAADRFDLPSHTLYHAMTARETPRTARQVRFCVRRDEIVPGKTGMVCRTRTQWADLGIEIDAGKG